MKENKALLTVKIEIDKNELAKLRVKNEGALKVEDLFELKVNQAQLISWEAKYIGVLDEQA